MGHALHCLPFISVWWDDWSRRWPFSGHGQPECDVVPFGLYRPCCSAETGIHQAEQATAQMSWAALSSPGLAFCTCVILGMLPLPFGRMEEITLRTSQGCYKD